MKQQTHNPKYGWGLIITLLVFFFPLGVFFLYKRYATGRGVLLGDTKALTVLAWFLLCNGFFWLYAAVDSDLGEMALTDASPRTTVRIIVVIGLGLAFSGLFVLAKSFLFQRGAAKYAAYLHAVMREGQSSLRVIADAAGQNFETARLDLLAMIALDFFPHGTHINEGRKEIVLPPGFAVTPQVITCASCGASTTVYPGRANKCEYCESPLVSANPSQDIF